VGFGRCLQRPWVRGRQSSTFAMQKSTSNKFPACGVVNSGIRDDS
jgi:hypothetical protein